jgi:DNA-binding protein H-NS
MRAAISRKSILVVENCFIKSFACLNVAHNLKIGSRRMKNSNLKSMSVDELWELHEFVVAELSQKMAAERAMLEDRLNKLASTVVNNGAKGERRPYPKVLPKYRNPENRSENMGRKWQAAALAEGSTSFRK